MQKDILQDEDGDIVLVNGDIVWGDGTRSHMKDLLRDRPGDVRTKPGMGVGFEDYLEDDTPELLYTAISRQFTADGMKVKKVFFEAENLIVDADYKNS